MERGGLGKAIPFVRSERSWGYKDSSFKVFLGVFRLDLELLR